MLGSSQPLICWNDQGEGWGLKRVFYQPMRVSSAYKKKKKEYWNQAQLISCLE